MIYAEISKKRGFLSGYNISQNGSKSSSYSDAVVPFRYTNAAVLNAFVKYQQILDNPKSGAIAIDVNGRYLIEYISAEIIECAVYNPVNGTVLAGKYDTTHNKMFSYDINAEDCSLLILSLIEVILDDSEARNAYEVIQLGLSDPSNVPDWTEYSNDVALLSDNILCRIKNSSKGISSGIWTNFMEANSTINVIPMASINNDSYAVANQRYGNTKLFKGITSISNHLSIPASEFNAMYKLTKESYDRPVSTLSDRYLVPCDIDECCLLIKKSSNLSSPFRNVLLIGDSGSGKTDGSYAIAAGLGLPHLSYNCHPDTDNFDLVGQFVPATNNKEGKLDSSKWLKKHHFPSLDDIENNPQACYKSLTGDIAPNGTKGADVIGLLIDKMLALLKSEHNGKEFTFVKSEIVIALEKGYAVEIAEASTIVNPGVLAGLNTILTGGYMALANGEKIFRHQNSVVIFTTNKSDYAGYGALANSIISRCPLVYEMNTPDISTMVERAIAKTEMENIELLTVMATCIDDAAKKLKEKGKKDGVCGFRELIDWIIAYQITGKAYKSAKPTVISKSTFDTIVKKEIDDLLNSALVSYD